MPALFHVRWIQALLSKVLLFGAGVTISKTVALKMLAHSPRGLVPNMSQNCNKKDDL
ncbi:hypothetical protein ADIMK_0178 [Marinobacterium lacunae]|uniref:Uncharacterized protein n=1 Tax=Marinobacterium lacunae TaxID=1232683 RepID=A0A081G4F1_9GAMM|nr:hypothetical protein ADIMK_0178 [Marinobacterium lacunae]